MDFKTPQTSEEFQSLARSLAQEQGISNVLAVYRIMDELYAREAANPANEKLACDTGCSGCCYQAVTTTKIEWLEIERVILETGVLSRLRKHINGLVAKWNQYFQKYPDKAQDPIQLAEDWMGRPCPLLNTTTKQCSVYAVRPVVCRTHTSTVRCATVFVQGRLLYDARHVEKFRYGWERWADEFLLTLDGHGSISRASVAPLHAWLAHLKEFGRQQT